jgi:hypothetical protein
MLACAGIHTKYIRGSCEQYTMNCLHPAGELSSGTMQVKDLGPRVSTTHAPGYWYICRFTYHLVCIYHVPFLCYIPPSETTFRWCGHVLVEPCRTQARVSCMYANSLVHLLFYTALSMFVHILLSFLPSGTTFIWCGSS